MGESTRKKKKEREGKREGNRERKQIYSAVLFCLYINCTENPTVVLNGKKKSNYATQDNMKYSLFQMN